MKRTLDTMPDVEYCPRCQSPVFNDNQDGDNNVQCAHCYYSFCRECQEAWHVVSEIKCQRRHVSELLGPI